MLTTVFGIAAALVFLIMPACSPSNSEENDMECDYTLMEFLDEHFDTALKPNPVKSSTFECGMETIGTAWVRFNFRYYFYALVFIALDVLVVFLYPWAVELKQLGLFGLTVVLVFIFLIVVGYIYAWKKKVLEWK